MNIQRKIEIMKFLNILGPRWAAGKLTKEDFRDKVKSKYGDEGLQMLKEALEYTLRMAQQTVD